MTHISLLVYNYIDYTLKKGDVKILNFKKQRFSIRKFTMGIGLFYWGSLYFHLLIIMKLRQM
ncbi:YSIRK-type signal peptide-containing protein [Mammaliicoccus sciuri]|uniref:YSIRK-type signal peptide-containing protein n=1 Tax=Mammaliicoccus sciuri TaxID=1296 RepID=UPI0034DD32B1